MISIGLLLNTKGLVKTLGKIPTGEFGLCTDSRKFEKGQLFFAIRGESFDGNKFAPEIVKNEGKICVLESNYEDTAQTLVNNHPDICIILVENSLRYLQELAKNYLDKWRTKGKRVICITGTNGKTTTKEMLAHILTSCAPGEIQKTQGNFNNQIGLPLTIFSLRPEHKVLVAEIGTNQPGEIEILSSIARPDMGTITNIGPGHIEYLKSEEGVFQEKKALYDNLMPDRFFLINDDDQFLKKLKNGAKTNRIGRHTDDINITYSDEGLTIFGKEVKNLNLIGQHNFLDLGMAIALASEIFPDRINDVLTAAETFAPNRNRSSVLNVEGKWVFLDAYNANPVSMRASLEGLVNYFKKQKWELDSCLFVLGDMNELGPRGDELHQEIGKWLRESGVKNVAFIGRFADQYKIGFGGEPVLVDKVDTFRAGPWSELFNKFDRFFIKGSNSLHLESLVAK